MSHILTLPSASQTVTLIPFSCVHADEDGHHRELWEECVETIERTPVCWAVGLGDYFSFARTHYRQHLRAYQQDEDSQREIDAMVKDRAREFYKRYLKRLAPKLLGLAEGNHTWTFVNNTTSTQYLCELAGVRYLGYASLHRLVFRRQRGGIAMGTLRMLLHHGDWSGGGQTLGGDYASLERRAEGWDADIFIAGHSHRKFAAITPIIELPTKGALRLVERPRAYIRAGCFLRGYMPGCTTYAERKLLKPTALGWVTLKIRFLSACDAVHYRALRRAGLSAERARNSRRSRTHYRFEVSY